MRCPAQFTDYGKNSVPVGTQRRSIHLTETPDLDNLGTRLIMLIGKPDKIKGSEITPESVYLNRRQFIGRSAMLGAGAIAGSGVQQQRVDKH